MAVLEAEMKYSRGWGRPGRRCIRDAGGGTSEDGEKGTFWRFSLGLFFGSRIYTSKCSVHVCSQATSQRRRIDSAERHGIAVIDLDTGSSRIPYPICIKRFSEPPRKYTNISTPLPPSDPSDVRTAEQRRRERICDALRGSEE
jgi:hypothetical protein